MAGARGSENPETAESRSSPRAPSASWWTTLPGILTGLAAFITATTGLVVAFQQFSGSPRDPDAGTPPAADSRPARPDPTEPPQVDASGAEREVAVPSGSETTVNGGALSIAISRMRLLPFSPDRRRLLVTLRFTNTGATFDRTYYTDFRLVIDGAEIAPDDPPLEQVEAHSAREFAYTFEIPAGANEAILRVIRGEETRDLPVHF